MTPRAHLSGPRRVFLHIGLPKTGTTYLQGILWENRRRLAADGVFLPGFGHREHLWAALDLAERPRLARRHRAAPGAWKRLVEECRGQSADGLITHEFLCAASREQAARAVADFADSEVHLVITARDAAGMVTAGWQEAVKNGTTVSLDEVIAGKPAGGPEFSMRAWDLADVLDRWGEHVPAERVHVLPMPGPDSPRDLHWHHFAGVIGVDPASYDAPAAGANTSLGIVQVELLRRVNQHLPPYSALDRGTWLRGYLAEGRLATQARQRGGLPERYREEFLARDDAVLALVEERGYDVVGDLELLRGGVPDPAERVPSSVTADELVDSAAQLVADILADVRASTSQVPTRRDAT
ncbi:hypothetical protein EXE58_13365 [Nocardioides seonyuensis]|uniref:Sulfotransferase family protein n=1 Tax=Nocardioides seonyuensis TaxID=2518371 RepID=A0A4P7IJA1_9ACTN|nr:hypothetical protein [Nocardioides seonyuensis]QBX56357.1 hypothetical protein EXE58_13365 [Nocardioides seonyuensis]